MKLEAASNSSARLPWWGLPRAFRDWLERGWRLISGQARKGRRHKLRIAESISLGDKRFMALVEVGEQQLLIAGTAQSITVLSRLRQIPRTEFARTLRQCERWVM